MDLIKKLVQKLLKRDGMDQEEFKRLGKAMVLWRLVLKVFQSHDYTGDLTENNQRWRRYTEERRNFATFSIVASIPHLNWEATEKNLKSHIVLLLRLNREVNDAEVLGLAILMDLVDYSFSCGMMLYPSSVDQCWEHVCKKKLPMVVNSLVRDFGGDPFEVEERLKTLYNQLELREHIPCYLYLRGTTAPDQTTANVDD